MPHLLTIGVFSTLLLGVGVFLGSMFRGNGAAIRAALVGTWTGDWSAEGALRRIGTCLRASFPSVEQEALSDDLNGLLLQLSHPPSR
jgi:hypothetical protein